MVSGAKREREMLGYGVGWKQSSVVRVDGHILRYLDGETSFPTEILPLLMGASLDPTLYEYH